MGYGIVDAIMFTVNWYGFIMVVCRCMSEENCVKAVYKIGFMTRDGSIYFINNIYPKIEDASRSLANMTKASLMTLYRYIFDTYVNKTEVYHSSRTINIRPDESVFVEYDNDESDEFVLVNRP